jgi:4a-hydroxytetrahydrobiopterin dehydratase
MDQNQIDTNLSNLNGWKLDNLTNSIHKEFSFKSYLKNIAFVNAVAWIANKMNHHPDLEVSFNKCVVKITTHDKSGLSDLDFQLAHEIEKL